MRLCRAAFLLLTLLASSMLGGCTEPADPPETLLQASHLVGDPLYSWGDPEFTKRFGIGSERRIRGEFTVPGDVARVGIAFRGSFEWPDNSTARLEITDGSGGRWLELNATKGRFDDLGEIGAFWQFRPVRELPPGDYQIVAAGEGHVGHLEFQVHGIPRFETRIEETFEVQEGVGEVELEVFLIGWGRTPEVVLVPPDRDEVPLPLDDANDETVHRFTAAAGTYRLQADTSAWGGRFVAQARHA